MFIASCSTVSARISTPSASFRPTMIFSKCCGSAASAPPVAFSTSILTISASRVRWTCAPRRRPSGRDTLRPMPDATPLLTAEVGSTRLVVCVADITTLALDAIVNAANRTLLGGGGVDGAIHRAAGPELRAECEKLGGCATGEAKITPGYRLPAKHVIHAVGPVWSGGDHGEDELLASCYRAALDLGASHRLVSLAFPAISTGVYSFPPDRAARIAVGTTAAEVMTSPRGITRVVFCCFAPAAADHHTTAFAELGLA